MGLKKRYGEKKFPDTSRRSYKNTGSIVNEKINGLGLALNKSRLFSAVLFTEVGMLAVLLVSVYFSLIGSNSQASLTNHLTLGFGRFPLT